MRFVDSYNKKVIYTNEHHLITLQFPFILNIKIYFHLFCRPIPSLNWGQVLSLQLIVLLIFQHCDFTIITKLDRMVVESNIS